MIKYKVYFDKSTGSVLGMTNRSLDFPNYFEAFYEDIQKFIEGNISLLDYKVKYNISTSNYEIVERSQKDEISVNDLIHKINNNQAYQIKVVKDNKNRCWKIQTSNDTRKKLQEVYTDFNENMHFSITKKNNPNILYRYFQCTVRDITDNDYLVEFNSQEEENLTNFSVYTNRKFEKYSYEVIDVNNQGN